jgi:hypothetical protein
VLVAVVGSLLLILVNAGDFGDGTVTLRFARIRARIIKTLIRQWSVLTGPYKTPKAEDDPEDPRKVVRARAKRSLQGYFQHNLDEDADKAPIPGRRTPSKR